MIFFPSTICAFCWISSFSYLGIFVPEDDIFSLQNFCLLLDFFIFLLVFFVPQDDIFSLQNFRLLLDFFIFLFGYFFAFRWYFFSSQFVFPAGILADQKPANFCPSIRGGWGILRFSCPIKPKHILSFLEIIFFIGQHQNSLMDLKFLPFGQAQFSNKVFWHDIFLLLYGNIQFF